MSVMERGPFEIRHEKYLREHFAMTSRDWCRNLAESRDAASEDVGEPTIRSRRRYPALIRGSEVQLHRVPVAKVSGTGVAAPVAPSALQRQRPEQKCTRREGGRRAG